MAGKSGSSTHWQDGEEDHDLSNKLEEIFTYKWLGKCEALKAEIEDQESKVKANGSCLTEKQKETHKRQLKRIHKETLRKLPVDGSPGAPSPRPQSSLCHRRVHRLQRFARNLQPRDRRALQMVLDRPVQASLESPQQLSTIRRRLRLALRILQVLIIYLP